MLALYLNMLDGSEEKTRFTEIYDRDKRLVFDSAKQILHDDALAEDVLQEVFLYVAENFTKLPTGNCHKMARYLVVASRTRACTMLERRKREITGEDYAPDECPDPVPVPEDATISAAEAAHLLTLVRELKEIYRAPLELLIQGQSYPEIAGLLGISQGTVRKRVERARQILWKELNRDVQ